MTRDPRRASDAEPRTHPLPVITDEMLPPLSEPQVPELDDRTLAELLAELDGDEPPAPEAGGVGSGTTPAPAPETAAPQRGVARTGPPRAPRPTGTAPGGYRLTPAGPVLVTEYGEHRPPVPPTEIDATSLTGLSRFARTRIGSRLFTLTFTLIFLALLAQLVVALLTAGT